MAIISGFSAARQDILPYSKGEGRPPIARGLNVIALKRRGYSMDDINIAKHAFKLLISDEYNTTQAIEQIYKDGKVNSIVEDMIEFVKTSKRGVTLKNHKSGFRSLEDE